MTDLTHLNALELRASNERMRLHRATDPEEIKQRQVWVDQCEREITAEKKFLGITEQAAPEMTIDEILAELGE